jgi:hypothetical protein
MGDPEVAIVEECVANCDAVLLNACTGCPTTLVNVVLVAFSISIHFTSIHPLYDRYARPATNNPTTNAAIFMTFLIAYPATAPKRIPTPAEKRKSSTGKSKHSMSSQYLYREAHSERTMDIFINLVIYILNDYTAVTCGISIPKLDHAVMYLSVSFCGSCRT